MEGLVLDKHLLDHLHFLLSAWIRTRHWWRQGVRPTSSVIASVVASIVDIYSCSRRSLLLIWILLWTSFIPWILLIPILMLYDGMNIGVAILNGRTLRTTTHCGKGACVIVVVCSVIISLASTWKGSSTKLDLLSASSFRSLFMVKPIYDIDLLVAIALSQRCRVLCSWCCLSCCSSPENVTLTRALSSCHECSICTGCEALNPYTAKGI